MSVVDESPPAPVFVRAGASFSLVPIPKCIHDKDWKNCVLCTTAWLIPWRRA